jgi:hypothetical protein
MPYDKSSDKQEEAKHFFFEKKKQKTFIRFPCHGVGNKTRRVGFSPPKPHRPNAAI